MRASTIHDQRHAPPPSRRTLLAGLTVGCAAGVFGWGTPAGAVAALPVVDMEAAVKAAQWDPVRADTTRTPGAAASVRLIEQALIDRGLLSAGSLDGHFGTNTVAAYQAWQRSLGLTGIAANGLPGKASLTQLGQGRFSLSRPLTPGPRVRLRGWPMNQRTADMLLAAEARAGARFTITQGSYSPGVDPTSAGTHDGGGVLDLAAVGMTPARRTRMARHLREVGFAAWVRSPDQGDWPWHVHAVAISDTDLAPQAARQVGAYYEGRNGLRGNGTDDGPAVTKVTYEEFRRLG